MVISPVRGNPDGLIQRLVSGCARHREYTPQHEVWLNAGLELRLLRRSSGFVKISALALDRVVISCPQKPLPIRIATAQLPHPNRQS
jgi:hypothetical protein